MAIGIRANDLRKVYNSPPPLAAASGMFMGPRKKRDKDKGKTPGKKIETVALDGVSLEIHPGEIFGLLGPNGAGKSTTVGIMTTRLKATSGEAFIGAYAISLPAAAVHRLIAPLS